MSTLTRQEFQEAVIQIDEQFEKIDERFQKIDERFMDLTDFLMKKFIEINQEMEKTNLENQKKYDKILSLLDGNVGKNEKIWQEKTMMTYEIEIVKTTVSNHENRIQVLEVAQK
ncbi:MAG: hypothetical protein WCJ84_06670 [Candidatus Peregrinibacteria bacterium]